MSHELLHVYPKLKLIPLFQGNPIANAIDMLDGGGYIVLMTAAGTAAHNLVNEETKDEIEASGVRITTIMVGWGSEEDDIDDLIVLY